MNTVNYLAEIWGISLVFVPLAFLINQKYLKRLFAEVENETSMIFWGVVSLVIGLAMVLFYNVWNQSWQVVITIIGWLSIIKGLALLFIPEYAKKWAKKIETSSFLPFALLILVFIGLILTYFGFAG